MASYLTQLWDEYSKLVLANTRDLDSRDQNYPQTVSAIVWQTVRQLRHGRDIFRMELRNERRSRHTRKPTR